ncbi:MAG: anthranilate synthase component II [Vulcanimicrobiaceae bacterium]
MKLLFVDNIDSFTYNVVHLLHDAGANVQVIRNDDPALRGDAFVGFDALCIGPGPGKPSDSPAMLDLVATAIQAKLPILGVCLGLQALGEIHGAKVVHAPRQMHGKLSSIAHDGSGIFSGIPDGFSATRYHSLCLDPATIPATLRVTATSDDGVVQGIAHRELPIYAVQFHPESVLSEFGHELAVNFLRLAR